MSIFLIFYPDIRSYFEIIFVYIFLILYKGPNRRCLRILQHCPLPAHRWPRPPYWGLQAEKKGRLSLTLWAQRINGSSKRLDIADLIVILISWAITFSDYADLLFFQIGDNTDILLILYGIFSSTSTLLIFFHLPLSWSVITFIVQFSVEDRDWRWYSHKTPTQAKDRDGKNIRRRLHVPL